MQTKKLNCIVFFNFVKPPKWTSLFDKALSPSAVFIRPFRLKTTFDICVWRSDEGDRQKKLAAKSSITKCGLTFEAKKKRSKTQRSQRNRQQQQQIEEEEDRLIASTCHRLKHTHSAGWLFRFRCSDSLCTVIEIVSSIIVSYISCWNFKKILLWLRLFVVKFGKEKLICNWKIWRIFVGWRHCHNYCVPVCACASFRHLRFVVVVASCLYENKEEMDTNRKKKRVNNEET